MFNPATEPVKVKVPVVNPLYVVPESRPAVIFVQREPLVLLCHCDVVANVDVALAVKVVSPPTQIELEIGCAVIAGVPVDVPTAKSPKSINPFVINLSVTPISSPGPLFLISVTFTPVASKFELVAPVLLEVAEVGTD